MTAGSMERSLQLDNLCGCVIQSYQEGTPLSMGRPLQDCKMYIRHSVQNSGHTDTRKRIVVHFDRLKPCYNKMSTTQVDASEQESQVITQSPSTWVQQTTRQLPPGTNLGWLRRGRWQSGSSPTTAQQEQIVNSEDIHNEAVAGGWQDNLMTDMEHVLTEWGYCSTIGYSY